MGSAPGIPSSSLGFLPSPHRTSPELCCPQRTPAVWRDVTQQRVQPGLTYPLATTAGQQWGLSETPGCWRPRVLAFLHGEMRILSPCYKYLPSQMTCFSTHKPNMICPPTRIKGTWLWEKRVLYFCILVTNKLEPEILKLV